MRRPAILLAFVVVAVSAQVARAAVPEPRYTTSPLVGTPASSVVLDRDADSLESIDAAHHHRWYTAAGHDLYPLAVAPGSAFVSTESGGQAELDLASGTLTPLALGQMPHGGSFRIERAGRRWLEGHEMTPLAYYTLFVDRLTGRVETSDQLGVHQTPDLDSDMAPARPLCPGVRRVLMRTRSTDGLADRYGRTFQRGAWVLSQTSPARNTTSVQLRRWQVQRCGSGAVVLRFTAQGTPALSAGRVAWADAHHVHLRRLAAERTTTLRLTELYSESTTVAFSADALLVSNGGDSPEPDFTTYRITLADL